MVMTVSNQFTKVTLELCNFFEEVDYGTSTVIVPHGVLRELSNRFVVDCTCHVSLYALCYSPHTHSMCITCKFFKVIIFFD